METVEYPGVAGGAPWGGETTARKGRNGAMKKGATKRGC
jgi:hypothetical protein